MGKFGLGPAISITIIVSYTMSKLESNFPVIISYSVLVCLICKQVHVCTTKILLIDFFLFLSGSCLETFVATTCYTVLLISLSSHSWS